MSFPWSNSCTRRNWKMHQTRRCPKNGKRRREKNKRMSGLARPTAAWRYQGHWNTLHFSHPLLNMFTLKSKLWNKIPCERVLFFWDVTPCSLIDVPWHFAEKYCLYFQACKALLSTFFLLYLALSWRWRWYNPPECKWPSTRLHSIESLTIILFIVIAVNLKTTCIPFLSKKR